MSCDAGEIGRFTTWSGYELLWKNIMHWAAGGRP